MSNDKAVSELVAVLLLIAIATVVVGIIAVFFFSNTQVQKIPEVDLSFTTYPDPGVNALTIYSQRGDPLYFETTQIVVGTRTFSAVDQKGEFRIRKKGDTTSNPPYWRDVPSTPYTIGDLLIFEPNGWSVRDGLTVDVIYNLSSGGVLIDKLGFGSSGSSTGSCDLRVSFTATPTTGISPLSVNFTQGTTIFGGCSIQSYYWDFGDGESSSEENPPPHIFTRDSTVTLTVCTDQGYCLPYRIDIDVTSNPCDTPIPDDVRIGTIPEPPLFFPASISEEITFTGVNPHPDLSLTWVWDFGNGQNATGPSPPIQRYGTGDYIARAWVSNGCVTKILSTLISIGSDSPDEPSILVRSPNGGEYFLVGTDQVITWEAPRFAPQQFTIRYSIDEGGEWKDLAVIPGNQYQLNWVIPDNTTTRALVQVSGVDGTGLFRTDQSNATFTIASIPKPIPSVQVTSPNSGENWPIGTIHEINWTAQNLTAHQYLIQYSVDGGPFTNITLVDGNTREYKWPVTGPATDNAIIKVIALDPQGNSITEDDSNRFSISQSILTVTSPIGGENWPIGTNHEINWTAQNITAHQYLIQYSVDNGPFNNITIVDGNTREYQWNVEGPATDNAIVRIIALDPEGNIIKQDDSNRFSISKPILTVTSPTGGENWPIGTNQKINWTTQNITAHQYLIQYSVDNGPFNNITIVDGNTREYQWNVEGPATNNAIIKIIALDPQGNPITEDDSNRFSISQPILTVTTPVGGENWPIGTKHQIDWNIQNLTADQFLIQYSVNSDPFVNITTVSGNLRDYQWNVTGPATDNAIIRVIALEPNGNAITSDESNRFSISQPILTVTSPNGGENWPIGTIQEINWTAQNITAHQYLIQYSIDGSPFTNITFVEGNTRTYQWNVTGTATDNAIVRVIALDSDGNIIKEDDSNRFSISQPILTVTSPEGGENWPIGTSQEINWTRQNLTAHQYLIQYSVDNSPFTNITFVDGNTREYQWIVTGPATDNAIVKIIALNPQGDTITEDDSNRFSISQPEINVTSPEGGENWPIGTTQEINWTTQNLTAHQYLIQYSVDGGPFTNITFVDGNTREYQWNVTGPATDNAIVKIIALNPQGDTITEDDSNRFSISQPVINVTSPEGGENWPIGTTHEINWTTQNLTAHQYLIQYSVNGGPFTNMTFVDGNIREYQWNVTGPTTDNAIVKIIALNPQGEVITEDDSNRFSISQPILTVTSPEGGENWPIGTIQEINWTTQNLTAHQYLIQYSVDGGPFTNITFVDENTREYQWNVTGPATDNAIVKIIALNPQGDTITEDYSNRFTISEPSITVEKPNGDEIYLVNSTHQITWTKDNLNAVNYTIEYSINNGTTWLPVISNLPGSNLSYPWIVPNTPTDKALVRVTGFDAYGNQIADQSDRVFTISDARLQVTRPNGGEYWLVNTLQQITWTPTNLTAERYTIRYSIDNGATWLPVASNLPGSWTSYTWQVPNTPSTQALVEIIGWDYYGNQIRDQSDRVFTIADPSVTVTTPNGGETYRVNTTRQIAWSWNNMTPANFTVEYSVNNGTSWIPIVSNLSGTSNTYNWLVPDTPSTQALVKVTGFDNYGNQIADQSNAVFTISKPTVTVISPNGGEVWFNGTQHQLSWNSTAINVANYTVQYTIDGGSTWTTIASNVPPTTTSYLWTVPNRPTSFALVRVNATEPDGTRFTDVSDNYFTIRTPRNCLGGRIFVMDSRENVTFTYTFSDAGYRNVYSLDSPRIITLGNNRETPRNTTWDLGRFNAGDELIFKDYIVNTGYSYFSGPASRNHDNQYHAHSYEISESSVWLGFEDSSGGGTDWDFNDIQFRVDNSVMVVCPGDTPNITVTSPNGGENWLVGSTHPITWSTNHIAPRNYTIEYSVSGSSGPWTTIATNVPGGSSSYDWLVPNTPSTNVRVRITAYDVAGTTVTDISNARFTISNPKINLTAPNGGETWQVGDTQQVTWNATGLNATSYALRYSIDNGAGWVPVVTNLPANSTSYTWTIPNTPTSQALVEVIATDTGGNQISDKSDRTFTIASPTVRVQSPNGGETWQVGQTYPITWSTANLTPANVTIQYSLNNGTTWLPLVSGLSGSNTSYNWTVPNNPTDQALIKIIATDIVGNQISDQSDRAFTIATPGITVQSPNGGETWLVGSTHSITWSSTNFTAVSYTIMYSVTNGSTWLPIALNIPASNTSFNWTVPNTPTTESLVKVIGYDAVGNQVDDQSDTVFTIVRPSVTVVSPNGGEVWYVGGTRPITWSTPDPDSVTSVLIEYSINNGATWKTINTTDGSSEYYNWVIPNEPTTTALIRITATYGSLGSVSDRSDNAFIIALWVAPDCRDEGGTQFGRIVAVKYNDLNGNGAQDPGEPNIPWWSISTEYEPDTGQGANLTNSSPTNVDGYYCTPCIKNSRWYTVSEEARDGWVHTTASSSTDKMLSNDPVQYRYVYFGNQQV